MSVPFSPLITQPKTPDFMKKLQSILWMAAAGFLATACEIPTQYEYVRLSDAACTFLADGNIPKAIEVAASMVCSIIDMTESSVINALGTSDMK